MQSTVRHELTAEEKEKLGKHVGEIAREIALLKERRKLEMKNASDEIKILQSDLNASCEQLRTGVREMPAQEEMFDGEDDRLEQCRRVVNEARGQG